jgi:hypothetical protein
LPKYSHKNTVKPSGMMVKARWAHGCAVEPLGIFR